MSASRSSDPFVEALARRLDAVPAVELQGTPRWKQAPAHGAQQRPRWTGRVRVAGIATAATCAVAAAVALVLVAAGSPSVDPAEAALPVFHRPVVDATRLRPLTPALARQQARYANAREISTPNGVGYVMPAADGSACLAVPDPADGYGESCASAEQIAQRGLAVVLSSAGGGAMAAVLPKTASGAVLHQADGGQQDLAIVDGVISATATGKASVSFRIGARLVSVPLRPDKACVQVDAGDPAPTQAQKQAVQRAGMRYCGDPAP
jgi:hypothetical protein